MKNVSRNQNSVATTQVQVSAGISRNEAPDAPAPINKTQTGLEEDAQHFIIAVMQKK